jgi:hypothetical protein
MKSILYDWGGGNVWLFHQINDIHGPLLDRAMLLGTALGGHANFVTYLAIASFAAILCVAVEARRNPHQLERFAVNWLAVLAVFSIAYVLDGMLLGWLKPLLDFHARPWRCRWKRCILLVRRNFTTACPAAIPPSPCWSQPACGRC